MPLCEQRHFVSCYIRNTNRIHGAAHADRSAGIASPLNTNYTMARSKESFNKREKEKQRAKQKQEKHEKMEERKAAAKKGRPLEDMMAYLDENGNLSTTPPDPSKKKIFNAEEIEIGVPQHRAEDEDPVRQGVVTFYNTTKGFGFIKDRQTGESVFFHEKQVQERLSEGDKVSFEVVMEPKGPVAVQVKKEK